MAQNTMIKVWVRGVVRVLLCIVNQKTHMNRSLLLLLSALPLVASAQTSVTVTTGPTNADQTWYSLQNGVQGSAPLAEWDMAFEITGFSSSILVNTARGLNVFETPASVAEWTSVNTVDESLWTAIHNSDTDWSTGALNHGNNLDQPDGLDLGWGTYNMITHTIAGENVYVIGFPGGTYRKLRIDGLVSGVFTFTHADLDGANEVTSTLVKPTFAGKNFGYYSFATNTTLDREPATSTWDLLFTKYIGFVPTPYAVAGVLQNKNVTVLQVDDVEPASAQYWGEEFSAEINTIGSDWKTFNMATFQYEYAQDRTYFVQDLAGNIWKLIFTGYGGSANGDMTFTQELASAVSVDEVGREEAQLVVYPNPTSNGQVTLVMDATSSTAVLSVHDMSGKLVAEQLLNGLSGMVQRTIDLGGLPQGMYLARLQADGTTTTARLIIE